MLKKQIPRKIMIPRASTMDITSYLSKNLKRNRRKISTLDAGPLSILIRLVPYSSQQTKDLRLVLLLNTLLIILRHQSCVMFEMN